mgnify:CR=1 FL=1
MPPHPFGAGRVTSEGTEPVPVLYTVRAPDKPISVPDSAVSWFCFSLGSEGAHRPPSVSFPMARLSEKPHQAPCQGCRGAACAAPGSPKEGSCRESGFRAERGREGVERETGPEPATFCLGSGAAWAACYERGKASETAIVMVSRLGRKGGSPPVSTSRSFAPRPMDDGDRMGAAGGDDTRPVTLAAEDCV